MLVQYYAYNSELYYQNGFFNEPARVGSQLDLTIPYNSVMKMIAFDDNQIVKASVNDHECLIKEKDAMGLIDIECDIDGSLQDGRNHSEMC